MQARALIQAVQLHVQAVNGLHEGLHVVWLNPSAPGQRGTGMSDAGNQCGNRHQIRVLVDRPLERADGAVTASRGGLWGAPITERDDVLRAGGDRLCDVRAFFVLRCPHLPVSVLGFLLPALPALFPGRRLAA